MRSPSSLNTQPWNVYVVTGEPLERIRAENTRRNLERIPSTREFRGMENYEGVHRERQVGIAKQLFGARCIARADQHKRPDWVLRGLRQLVAPARIVVPYDRVLVGSDLAPFACGRVRTTGTGGLRDSG